MQVERRMMGARIVMGGHVARSATNARLANDPVILAWLFLSVYHDTSLSVTGSDKLVGGRRMSRLLLGCFMALSIVVLWAVPGSAAGSAQDQYVERNTNRPGLDYTSIDIRPSQPGDLWGPEINC